MPTRDMVPPMGSLGSKKLVLGRRSDATFSTTVCSEGTEHNREVHLVKRRNEAMQNFIVRNPDVACRRGVPNLLLLKAGAAVV